MKWAPKRDLQSEEKFLDVDCLGFGNTYMLLRQVEQSSFFNFLPNFWKSHQKC